MTGIWRSNRAKPEPPRDRAGNACVTRAICQLEKLPVAQSGPRSLFNSAVAAAKRRQTTSKMPRRPTGDRPGGIQRP
jgi:hypothetical protein